MKKTWASVSLAWYKPCFISSCFSLTRMKLYMSGEFIWFIWIYIKGCNILIYFVSSPSFFLAHWAVCLKWLFAIFFMVICLINMSSVWQWVLLQNGGTIIVMFAFDVWSFFMVWLLYCILSNLATCILWLLLMSLVFSFLDYFIFSEYFKIFHYK